MIMCKTEHEKLFRKNVKTIIFTSETSPNKTLRLREKCGRDMEYYVLLSNKVRGQVLRAPTKLLSWLGLLTAKISVFMTPVTSFYICNQDPLLTDIRFLRKWLGMRLFWRNSNKRVSEQLMLWPTNAGNTMTFLTITTFNQLQSKPLVCMASPLLPRWAVSQRNSLTFQAIPGSDSGSTSACLWQWSEGTPPAYLPCVQVWSYFSHPQCINQCSCLSFASLQCIAIAFRMPMSVFSVSFIDFNMFFKLSVKPLSLRSIVLLLSSAMFCGKNETLG